MTHFHMTHHADCGCLTAKHEAELSSLRAQLAEVTARLRECEGALAVFLEPRKDWPADVPDSCPVYREFTVGDLRRAASLLRQPEPSGEGGPLVGARAQDGSVRLSADEFSRVHGSLFALLGETACDTDGYIGDHRCTDKTPGHEHGVSDDAKAALDILEAAASRAGAQKGGE